MPGAPLRILQLYPKRDIFTGAAIQLRDLARGLQRLGHDVVVATAPSPAWAAEMAAAGIPYHPLPMASAVDLRAVRGLARLVSRHRIQIVHAHKGRARTLALLAGLLTRIPALVVNRGVSFPLSPVSRLGYTTRRVAAVVAVSEAVRGHLLAAGVPPEKIHVIYSGTDTDRFHPGVDGTPIRRALGLDDEDVLFTQVGVRSVKGNDETIRAFALVAARVPRAHLLVVGARRPDPLEALVRAAGLEARVHIWGYRTDIPAILAASDCCVDASWAGVGLTGALREALAVETAVVATAVAGNPELVRHEETGLLVPPHDVPALAAAMARMAEDRALRETTARAGRKLVGERFSTTVKLEAIEALYRRLAAERA